MQKIRFFKGKVAKITQDKGKRILRVEDTTKEALNEIAVDMGPCYRDAAQHL